MIRASHVVWVLLTLLLLSRPQLSADEADSPPPGERASQRDAAAIAAEARDSVVVIKFTGRDGGQQGLGTGFVISADGLIATNLHVLGEARPLSVETAAGKSLQVTSVHASDRNLDLAILKVDAKNLQPLELGDPQALIDGQPIVVLGNPHGLKHSVVSGVVSGRREIDGRQMLQLAIPIEPGNSGGPVLDMQGRVHGLVTIKSLVTENLGFAIPVNQLQPLVDDPNPIPLSRWLTIGALDPAEWTTLFGANWQQRGGRILVEGSGEGFGGRSLCLWQGKVPEPPYEIGVGVRMNDESGAAGLVFYSDGGDRHYGFYPSNGNLRLSRFEGPNVFTWKVLHDEPSEFYRPGDWNHLKVRLEEEKIQCFVNDQLVVESTDRVFKSGHVGLAKFRDTEAQFKSFQAARQIAALAPPEEMISKLRDAIGGLPKLAEIKPQQIADLAASPAASAMQLRAEAKSLQERADDLRRLASEVHAQGVVQRLTEHIAAGGDDFDLLTAALMVANLDEEELDVAAYVRHVDRMAEAVRESLAEDADSAAKLAALNKYLFEENGFHGSRTEYYHRANSYLNRVIDDREGLPITLSVLYMELGKRLGLNIEGVGLPGHFVVRHLPPDGEAQLIDVFEEGETLTEDDADRIVLNHTGQPLKEEHLAAADSTSILVRMLHNLLGVAQGGPDREAMLRYLDALLAIEPDSISNRGMRAIVRYETGRRDAAIADLDWIIERRPEELDLERLQAMREHFRTHKP